MDFNLDKKDLTLIRIVQGKYIQENTYEIHTVRHDFVAKFRRKFHTIYAKGNKHHIVGPFANNTYFARVTFSTAFYASFFILF